MMKQYRMVILGLLLIVAVAACAPANLDITPSPMPTEVPTATPTPDAATMEEASANESIVDEIIAVMPATIAGGAVQWRYDTSRDIETVRNVEGGIAKKVYLNEAGGGQANLTFGAFESTEAAVAHYDRIAGLRAVLEQGETLDNFPLPNLFGSGLYGSNAIFQIDNVFLEVSVEAFSSTAGNPLPALSRGALGVMSDGLGIEIE